MSGEITRAVLDGVQVVITPDCWPLMGKVNSIQVSMTMRTWSGAATLNRNIPVGLAPEQVDAEIVRTIAEMAGTIDLPHKWKG
jgi:hypothetical protein